MPVKKARKSQHPQPPPEEVTEEYRIDNILKARVDEGKNGTQLMYKVKWEGYEDLTWESEARILSATEFDEKILQFWEKQKNPGQKFAPEFVERRLKALMMVQVLCPTSTNIGLYDNKLLDSSFRELLKWENIRAKTTKDVEATLTDFDVAFRNIYNRNVFWLIRCSEPVREHFYTLQADMSEDFDTCCYEVPDVNKFVFDLWTEQVQIAEDTFGSDEDEDEEDLPPLRLACPTDPRSLINPIVQRRLHGLQLLLRFEFGRWCAFSSFSRMSYSSSELAARLDYKIPAGKIICRLGGELRSVSECRPLYAKLGECVRRYFIEIPGELQPRYGEDQDLLLDRRNKRDISHYFGHSCEPNCRVVWARRDPSDRMPGLAGVDWYMAVQTINDIGPSKALTLDWYPNSPNASVEDYCTALDTEGVNVVRCFCATDGCRMLLANEKWYGAAWERKVSDWRGTPLCEGKMPNPNAGRPEIEVITIS